MSLATRLYALTLKLLAPSLVDNCASSSKASAKSLLVCALSLVEMLARCFFFFLFPRFPLFPFCPTAVPRFDLRLRLCLPPFPSGDALMRGISLSIPIVVSSELKTEKRVPIKAWSLAIEFIQIIDGTVGRLAGTGRA